MSGSKKIFVVIFVSWCKNKHALGRSVPLVVAKLYKYYRISKFLLLAQYFFRAWLVVDERR